MRGFYIPVGLAMALAVPTLASAPLAGQVVQIRREIIDSQRRLEEVREERSRLQQELTNLDGRVRNAASELANVERQVSASRSAVAEVDFQVEAVGSEIEGTSRNLLRTRDRLQTSKAILHRRIRDIYKRGALHSVRVMLGAGSFPDLLTRYRYLRLIASYDRTLVLRVGELETDLEQENDDLQISMASLGRLRQSRLSEVAALRSVENTHRQTLVGYHAQEEEAANQLEELDRDETRIGALLTDLEARRVEIERGAARRGAPSTLLTADVGTMNWAGGRRVDLSIRARGETERHRAAVERNRDRRPHRNTHSGRGGRYGRSGRSVPGLRSDGGAESRRRFLYAVPLP